MIEPVSFFDVWQQLPLSGVSLNNKQEKLLTDGDSFQRQLNLWAPANIILHVKAQMGVAVAIEVLVVAWWYQQQNSYFNNYDNNEYIFWHAMHYMRYRQLLYPLV